MKNFLKMTLATLLGLIIFASISCMVAFATLGAVAALSSPSTTIKPNSVFELKLEGQLVERNENGGFAAMKSLLDDSQAQLGLDEVLTAIEAARTDENIKGIYLNMGDLMVAPASLCEIRTALARFKADGKFIVAYADSYGNGTYALATVADKLVLNPQGLLGMVGLSMNTLFIKDALDKLGIEMQIVKVGTFKSAVEPYVNMAMSDANRLQMSTLANSLWSDLRAQMADGRQLPAEVFDAFANEGAYCLGAEFARNRQLVDTLAYRADMKQIIKELVGNDYKTVNLQAMLSASESASFATDKIAVVYASGTIDGAQSSVEDGIDSEKLTKTLLQLADDDNVKAVVLRVNSPGGSAYGSEQIWDATMRVKAKKPFVVSMGDYAASGGYYISCAADTIVAQPTTITGSIGIFGTLPCVKGLINRVGVAFDGVKTHKFSDFGHISRPLSEAERALLQHQINNGYELFVKRCADGRHTTTDAIKAVAEGRVWSGRDALGIGLVDVLGGLDDAVEIAAAKAGLESYDVKEYPAKRDFMTEMLEMFSYDTEERVLQRCLGKEARYVRGLQRAQSLQGVQALMPFDIVFE